MSPGDAGEPLLVCPAAVWAPSVSSVRRCCAVCGRAVWVSWVMAPVVDSGETAPWCEECVADRHGAGAQIEVLRHPRQAASGMTVERFDALAAQVIERVHGGRRRG